MVIARITGFISILFGIYLGVKHFGFFSFELFGYDVGILGVVVFLCHELYSLVHNWHGDGFKPVSVGVPLFFLLVGLSYFGTSFLPEFWGSSIGLIVGVLMTAEGLYRLH